MPRKSRPDEIPAGQRLKSGGGVVLRRTTFDALPSWPEDNLEPSLQAFRRSAAEILNDGRGFERGPKFGGQRRQWLSVCRKAETATSARSFFEENFVPVSVWDGDHPSGLFTGYYEPEVEGRRVPDDVFAVPIYGKPPELVGMDAVAKQATGLAYGRLEGSVPVPYATRHEIEQGALDGRGLEIMWLRDWADAFFIHIQGSGRVRLPERGVVRLAYAGKNGQPYTAIGGLMVQRGILTPSEVSMQAIRSWMSANPQAARELMWENRSFIFFREERIDDASLGPPGAEGVLLTPRRSLAVDRTLWAFGTPVWLDTEAPTGESGTLRAFRKLMIAQDTGSAIRGLVRGDVFWGAGLEAARAAGHMKNPGRMTVLLPHEVADELVDGS